MGRTNVALPGLDVEVYKNPAANFTATLSNNKYINDASAPVMKFYDANIGVVDASKMKGSFSIIDSKYDLPIILGMSDPANATSENDFNDLKVIHVDADGIETDVTSRFAVGSGIDNICLASYKSETDDPATTTVTEPDKFAWGLKITPVNIPGAEAGDKLVIVITHTLRRPYDTVTLPATSTVAFELVIAE